MNKFLNNKLIFVFLIIFYSNLVFGIENKILFKLENKSFTSFDYENRKNYINFIGDNSNLTDEEIVEDYISVLIFHEYYKDNNFTFDIKNKSIKIFEDIYNTLNDIEKNKVLNNRENLITHLKYDLIRKNILEIFLNSQKEEIFIEQKDIDLIYKFELKYINVYINEIKDNIEEFINRNFKNISEVEQYLNNNDINFFTKNNEITNLNNINKDIQNNIKTEKYFYKKINNQQISFISIAKKFETYDGLIAHLFSITSKKEIERNDLDCKLLDINNVTNKEYEYAKLNNEIKSKLININDYVKINDGNNFTYIVLCGIKFDKEILNNININKKINTKVNILEKNFINQFSKKYNLIINYE